MLLQEQMRITEQQREIFALREQLQNAQDQITVLEDLRTIDLARLDAARALSQMIDLAAPDNDLPSTIIEANRAFKETLEASNV